MPDNQTPGGTPENGQQPPENNQGGTPPVTFEAWLTAQDDHTRGLIDTHTKGLKSALDAEREQRKTLERQLREAAGKLDKDSDARKQLEGLSAQLDERNRQLDFYDAARAAKVANLRLAWLAAKQDNLLKRNGDVDMDALREAYPELFETVGPQKAPTGNAGAGTGSPPKQVNMNTLIRRAAGRE